MKSLFSIAAVAALAVMTLASSANAEEKKVARAVASAKVRPLSVSIALISATKLNGTLTDTTTLEMRTSFGTAQIPLSEVAGIKFASASDASTTVVMLNGDSITGATDVKLVTMETEWGMATINGPNIASIMFVPGLNWSPVAGLNGKRWTLANTKAKPVPPPTAPPKTTPAPTAAANSRTPAATNSRSNSRSQYNQPSYRGR